MFNLKITIHITDYVPIITTHIIIILLIIIVNYKVAKNFIVKVSYYSFPSINSWVNCIIVEMNMGLIVRIAYSYCFASTSQDIDRG